MRKVIRDQTMQINLESPQHIYSNILLEIRNILTKLGNNNYADEQLSQANDTAIKILMDLKGEIDKHIKSLERNAEWDTFTIAFYGETNAGKSTIIETLRIIMQEQGKTKAQKEFKALQNKHGTTEESFKSIRQSIQQNEEGLLQLQDEMKGIIGLHELQEKTFKDEIIQLERYINEKNKAASFWQKLLNFFWKFPEEKKRKLVMKNLKLINAERNKDLKLYKQQKIKISKEKLVFEKEHTQLISKLKHLELFADGGIIGNGSSDYTIEAQQYKFEFENQKFTLLDLPGIEGKESKVIDSILLAVQKAHAVFYVTSKASAPQKGSDDNKGTLEKIKEHLDSQTEVWTIFNKRITNPIQLDRGELINQDERESLHDLECKMREQLGENYKNIFTLSAHPAFLSVADCLLPESSNAESKLKFLSRFNSEELLHKSNVMQFHALLTDDLVKDKTKIRRSNFNKVNKVVIATTNQIDKIQRESFLSLSQNLKKDAEDARYQLECSLNGLKNGLESQGEKAINEFNNSVRKKIYNHIDNDISNDKFKIELERCIDEEQLNLKRRLPEVMQVELDKFQKSISDVINQFQQHAKALLEIYSKIRGGDLDNNFDLKIDIDNGIKLQNLVGALVGGGVIFWNPVGWVVIALSIATLLVSLGKAVLGFFSSSYKMAQQRKSADENLQAITKQMRSSMHKSLDTAFPELQSKVEVVKNALDVPYNQVTEIIRTLEESVEKMTILSKTIELEGAK